MITSRRRWLLGTLLLSAILTGGALYATYMYGEEDLYLQNTSGAGIHLKAPYRYRELSDYRRGSVRHFLALTIPFSELELLTRTSGDLDPPAPKVADTNFKVTIQLRISGSRPMESYFSDALQQSNLAEDLEDGDFDVYRHVYGTVITEYRVPKAQERSAGRSRTILKCDSYTDASHTRLLWPYCYANVQYTDRFYVVYDIPLSALAEWRSIEADVLAFVRARTIDCFDSNPASHDVTEMTFYPCSN